jgi:flagellar assembly protein FliH
VAKQILTQDEVRIEPKPKIIDTYVYMTEEERKEALRPKVIVKDDYEEKVLSIEEEFERYQYEREQETEAEINQIIKAAEKEAFSIVKKAVEEYEGKILGSTDEVESLVKNEDIRSQEEIQEAMSETELKVEIAQQEGYKKGKKEGLQDGQEEVERLISRLNTMLSMMVQKRMDILKESNYQVMQVMIYFARTAINAIIEKERRVVYDNIVSVLKRLKGRAEITIRVCSDDLAVVSRHKKEFMQMVEGLEQLRIVEDQSVDRGGCIIDTDFGTIDSRISLQMENIEETIFKTFENWDEEQSKFLA